MLQSLSSATTRKHNSTDEFAFFCADGIPTKGIWIDLSEVAGWSDIQAALCEAKLTGESYGGDILVADVEGPLARACFSPRYDVFDLASYLELRDAVAKNCFNPAAVIAFINWYGAWDQEAFDSAYMGHWESESEFAEQLIVDTGTLSEVPEHLQCYFDIERFARDLFMGDYFFDEGFVFCSNC